MSYLVERLRDHFEGVSDKAKSSTFDLVLEAAARIEQLEAALWAISNVESSADKTILLLRIQSIKNIACVALDQKASA